MEAAATWPTPGRVARAGGEAAAADTDGRPARDREGRVRTLLQLRLKPLAATAAPIRPRRPQRAPRPEEDHRARPGRLRARPAIAAAVAAAATSPPRKEAPRTPKFFPALALHLPANFGTVGVCRWRS